MTVQFKGVPFHKLGEKGLASRIVKKLMDCYPGYYWQVHVNDDLTGGVVDIINATVEAERREMVSEATGMPDNTTEGYTLHLTQIFKDPDLDCVMRAGGEILERANLRRGRIDKSNPPDRIEGVDKNKKTVIWTRPDGT